MPPTAPTADGKSTGAGAAVADADGKAGPNVVKAVTDLVSEIAHGVRSAAKAAVK